MQGNNELMLVCLYVDDIIYMGSSKSMIEDFKRSMMSHFEMSDLGLLHYFLGLEIKQMEGEIFVSQKNYAENLLKKFNMLHCKQSATPMNTGEKLYLNDGSGEADARSYRKLVGGLIYLTHTSPDIMFAVGIISRFMQCPTKHHFGAARRVPRYIAGTLSYGLHYTHVNDFKLYGYTDNDWAGSIEDRKSTSGCVFIMGSAAVTWSSKKQEITALSTTEAEYVATTSSACQAIWIRRILTNMGQ